LQTAAQNQQDFLESEILVLAEEAADEGNQKAIAELKTMIAQKRAELEALETKLKMVLDGADAKKAGRVKIKNKADEEKLKKATKLKLDSAQNADALKKAMELMKIELKGLDINVDVENAIKKAIPLEKLKKDGKEVKMELILDALKGQEGLKDVIIKKLDGKELKIDGLKDIIIKAIDGKEMKGDILKKVDGELGEIIIKTLDGKDMELIKKGDALKKIDGKGRIFLDKKPQNIEVIVETDQPKGGNIEARLEKLMKELQELQREVKASKRPPK